MTRKSVITLITGLSTLSSAALATLALNRQAARLKKRNYPPKPVQEEVDELLSKMREELVYQQSILDQRPQLTLVK